MTAKPAEDLSAAGCEGPPEGCPGRTSLLGPSVGHLCQGARHRVPDPAPLLFPSLQPDLTPSGIYKDLFSKGELETGHPAATDPTDTSSCA